MDILSLFDTPTKIILVVIGAAVLWWLSKYFVTQKEFKQHKEEQEKVNKANETALKEINTLSNKVTELDTHIKHLPTSEQAAKLTGELQYVKGLLEGFQPFIKHLANNDAIIFEAELKEGKR